MKEEPIWLIDFSPGEIRAACLDEAGRLVEMRIERLGEAEIVGSIHLGRITRIEKSIGAAFVEFGDKHPGFLGKAKNVTEGQAIVVQVVRAAGAGKGAILTGNPVIPGRFLALHAASPGIHWPKGKLEGDRAGLAALLAEIAPEESGIVPGPLAGSADPELLKAELERLSAEWRRVKEAAAKAKPPALLHTAPGILDHILREARGTVVMNDPERFSATRAAARTEMPDLFEHLVLYKGDAPLFDEYGVEEQLDEALSRRVELAGGASLAIDETEALTAVDVNMGGAGIGAKADNAIRSVNQAAARELARQIRLRNLGGLIVVDFISMKNKAHRKQLVELLRREMRDDPVRHDVLGITPGGLVEITRRRIGRPLADFFAYRQAPARPPLPAAQCCAALRDALGRPWSPRTVLAANPRIVDLLQGRFRPALDEVNRRLGVALELVPEPERDGYEFRQR